VGVKGKSIHISTRPSKDLKKRLLIIFLTAFYTLPKLIFNKKNVTNISMTPFL